MKLWEAMRKPLVVVRPWMPIRGVKALFRKTGERIAPVTDEEDRVQGYVTRVETIMVTSQKSAVTAKDVMRDHPILEENMDVEEAYRLMLDAGTWEAPVVEGRENPVLRGVVTLRDILQALVSAGYRPIAESVAEVMTTKGLDMYIVTPDDRVTKAWSRLVYRGLPGLIVVRSRDERRPVGMLTLKDFVDTDRWLFRRESERGFKTPAKVRRIMTRGAVVATPDTPVEYVARFMVENDFSLLPVIDEEGRLIGVVTQADVVRAYLEGGKPGRVPVPVIRLPRPVAAEERVAYATRRAVLTQALIEKPAAAEILGLTARDVARPELPAVTVNDTVEHARREMLRRKTNYLLVLDDNGSIVGVVSKWSMLRAIALKGPLWKRRVNDRLFIDYVMDKDIPRVKEDEPLENVALAMLDKGAEVAFTVDEEGRITGFITKDDLVEAYRKTQAGRALVENVMAPPRIGVVHPHHSLYHVVSKMKTFYLDALTVADGSRLIGVVSANRLPFVAYEDAVTGFKSRRLIWVRKLVRSAARRGRYVKVLPLVAIDVTVPLKEHVKPKDDVVKAIELMQKHGVDGIPVVDEEGRILGVVCKNDVIRELARAARPRAEEKPRITAEAKP